jgi:hypothetical protein
MVRRASVSRVETEVSLGWMAKGARDGQRVRSLHVRSRTAPESLVTARARAS